MCQSILTEATLLMIDEALKNFHQYQKAFQDVGICVEGFSLPRQHSLIHYLHLICLFAAPNGLCTSITESKHIKAVKEPWCRSNRYNALGQMLITNQRLDKLAASRVNFEKRGMLKDPVEVDQSLGLDCNGLPESVEVDCNDGSADGPKTLGDVKLASRPCKS